MEITELLLVKVLLFILVCWGINSIIERRSMKIKITKAGNENKEDVTEFQELRKLSTMYQMVLRYYMHPGNMKDDEERKRYKQVGRKMKEILHMLEIDEEDKYVGRYYKYEESVKKLITLIENAHGVGKRPEVYKRVGEVVDMMHEDILSGDVTGELVKDIDDEIRILKDLRKMKTN